MLGFVFTELLPENIVNVNHQLLKKVLCINRDFMNLLSNSCFEFKLQNINIKCLKDPAKDIEWTAFVKMINS